MMKKRFKKISALITSLALLFSFIVTTGITAVANTTGIVTIIGAGHDFYYWNSSVTYYNKILGKNITQASGECIAEFEVAGQPYYSFCINFGLHSKSGNYTGSTSNGYFDKLSLQQRNKMALSQYYGYPANENKGFNASQGRESYVAYAATQLLIWEFESGLRNYDDYSYSSSNSNCLINHISGTSTYSYDELKAKYLSILGKIEAFTQRPTFTTSESATAKTYTLKYNALKNRYEYTFPADSQISKFNLSKIKSAGLGYELNGNTLTVYSASSFTGTKSAKIEKSIDQTILNSYKSIFWTIPDPDMQVLMGGCCDAMPLRFLKKLCKYK